LANASNPVVNVILMNYWSLMKACSLPQVHKELTMAVTPANGLSASNVYAVTPQFRIPLASYEDDDVAPTPSVESPEAASPSNQVLTVIVHFRALFHTCMMLGK
jgi:hypothetical protein